MNQTNGWLGTLQSFLLSIFFASVSEFRCCFLIVIHLGPSVDKIRAIRHHWFGLSKPMLPTTPAEERI